MSLLGDAESERLVSLQRTGLLDSKSEAAYDAIVELARDLTGVPIALVSLVDRDRQWFKARVGLDVEETPRDVAFCDHAIRTPFSPLVVEDAQLDPRFQANPLVVGDPNIRFYAGYPIVDEAGFGLGTLCVIDRVPRQLTAEQSARLRALADVVQELVHLRVLAHDLDASRRRAVLFERGFDAAGIGKQIVDRDGVLLRVNPAFAAMIGRTVDDLVGHHWWEFAHPDNATPDPELELQLDIGAVTVHRSIGKYLHAAGHTVWAVVHVVPVMFDGTAERINYVQVTNITDTIESQHRADAALRDLRRSERRLSSLTDPSPDPVMLISHDGLIEAMNPAAITAFSPNQVSLVGSSSSVLAVRDDLYDDVRTCIRDALVSGVQREMDRVWFEPAVGPAGWYRLRVLPVIDPDTGNTSAYVTATNVTEAVENEQRLAALALVDPLTGAANRAALYDRLEQALTRLDRCASAGVGIAMIDLDHFKALNDTHGHETGDSALVAVVAALKSVVRGHDTVARLGGDEFVVMFDDVGEDEFVEILAPRLSSELTRVSVGLSGGALRMTGSVGVAWSPKRQPGRELIAQADAALLQAKRHGRNRIWQASRQRTDSPFSSDAVLRRDLVAALERRQFSLRYQPIVDAHNTTTAVEALLRWEHHEHGTLEPSVFIGTLIETGLIATVGHWTLRQAVIDAASIAATSTRPIAMHVNLSPGEIASTEISNVIRSLFAEHHLDPTQLVIEVTEQALMGTVVSTSAITELASTGVRLALDDFGTGSSSLAHLRHRPLHGLKLDGSFVSGIGHNDVDMAILSGAISIARRLGLEVVAEGVTTNDQHDWLINEGCTRFQGWLTGRPVRLDELDLS